MAFNHDMNALSRSNSTAQNLALTSHPFICSLGVSLGIVCTLVPRAKMLHRGYSLCMGIRMDTAKLNGTMWGNG